MSSDTIITGHNSSIIYAYPQTLMDLISKLAVRNGFEFHRDGTQKVETIKLSYYEEASIYIHTQLVSKSCT